MVIASSRPRIARVSATRWHLQLEPLASLLTGRHRGTRMRPRYVAQLVTLLSLSLQRHCDSSFGFTMETYQGQLLAMYKWKRDASALSPLPPSTVMASRSLLSGRTNSPPTLAFFAAGHWRRLAQQPPSIPATLGFWYRRRCNISSSSHMQMFGMHRNQEKHQGLPAVCCGCSELCMLNILLSTGGSGRNGIPLHASHAGTLPPW